jgi:hypothetical protein
MIPLPKWLDDVPEGERSAARRRFLLRLAALYSSREGHYYALSVKAGLSHPKSIGMYLAPQQKRRMNKKLAEGVEKATEGMVPAAMLFDGRE